MEIIIVIASIALIIYVIKKKKTKKIIPKNIPNKYFNHVTTTNNYTYVVPLIKYKNKCIEKFEIAGMNYRNLNNSNKGFFKGYVIIENNKHDPYAIAVYTNKGLHVGYLPGGSEKRFNILNNKPHKATFAWGFINHNPKTNNFFGVAFVTMCLTEEEINKIKHLKPTTLLTNENLITN